MRPHAATTSTVALVGALLLGACSGGDGGPGTAQLQADLDAQARAQESLRARIGELEDRLTAATADTGEDPTAGLTERIDELTTRIEDVSRALDEAETAREDAQAETLASLSALDAAITELRGTLDELSTELTKLREDHELLVRRFENHSH